MTPSTTISKQNIHAVYGTLGYIPHGTLGYTPYGTLGHTPYGTLGYPLYGTLEPYSKGTLQPITVVLRLTPVTWSSFPQCQSAHTRSVCTHAELKALLLEVFAIESFVNGDHENGSQEKR